MRYILTKREKILYKQVNLGSLLLLAFLILHFGVISNFIVITSNGGKMPVYVKNVEDCPANDYSVIESEGVVLTKSWLDYCDKKYVNYWYLGDIFVFFKRIYSIGDVLMISGFIFMAITTIRIFINNKRIKKVFISDI